MKNDEKFSKIMNFVLEGKTVAEALSLTEAKVDATNVEAFTGSSFYKNMEKIGAKFLKKIEGPEEYRKGEWAEDTRLAIDDELEELEYAANIIKGLALANYPADAITAVNKLVQSAFNGVRKGHQKLDSTDDEKLDKAFTPLEYTKRALTLWTAVFKILGIPWDYDHEWQGYLYDVPAKYNAKSPAYKNADLDADDNRKIDVGVPEERLQDLALIISAADVEGVESLDKVLESMECTEAEKDALTRLWNKFIG